MIVPVYWSSRQLKVNDHLCATSGQHQREASMDLCVDVFNEYASIDVLLQGHAHGVQVQTTAMSWLCCRPPGWSAGSAFLKPVTGTTVASFQSAKVKDDIVIACHVRTFSNGSRTPLQADKTAAHEFASSQGSVHPFRASDVRSPDQLHAKYTCTARSQDRPLRAGSRAERPQTLRTAFPARRGLHVADCRVIHQ